MAIGCGPVEAETDRQYTHENHEDRKARVVAGGFPARFGCLPAAAKECAEQVIHAVQSAHIRSLCVATQARLGSTPRAFSAPVALAVPQIPGRVFHGQQPGALGQETGFQQGAGKADESAALSLLAAWA